MDSNSCYHLWDMVCNNRLVIMRRFLFLLVVAPIVNTALFVAVIELIGLIF